ncbi:molybdopterin-guanine dinucleotide biosynthesis protein B [Bacillus infantis]|uniref:molybdopterin-guanine dinucleotide biosynthesis protein B n=1 Tax=Bacillus infantis TaxID=324767 RepID=UPI001CD34A6B|nr:molybdopterin-guanine dinucleotide biosynthesis protein B [Bacillus infantis]MCA1039500.1 molybdopterin-guanine dinucleotide biosynthesis protein B [Bacillus infantis]
MVEPVIFQIVGFKNSGKTTLVQSVIRELQKQGYAAVTIKHHGHGGKPDVLEDKDTSLHMRAGALASLAEGEGSILIQADNLDWPLERLIQLMAAFGPDIILIEGYKKECYPKAVIARNLEEAESLSRLDNVHAAITPLLPEEAHPYFGKKPVWPSSEAAEKLAAYIISLSQ